MRRTRHNRVVTLQESALPHTFRLDVPINDQEPWQLAVSALASGLHQLHRTTGKQPFLARYNDTLYTDPEQLLDTLYPDDGTGVNRPMWREFRSWEHKR